jgi:predicted Zn-dependent protease
MGYFAYYLAWVALSYALHQPALMLGVLVMLALRPFLPDPWALLRTWGRIRALDTQIAANPANVTARRDLAEIWIERLRPGRALQLLDEARERDPSAPELLYLTGLARLRLGDAHGALQPLVRAVEIDPKLRYGQPYLVAAEALIHLGRLDEAEDALERYSSTNSSSLQGYVWLAHVRKRRGDTKGAHAALREALDTWAQLPRYRRRRELGWWFRAQLARVLG